MEKIDGQNIKVVKELLEKNFLRRIWIGSLAVEQPLPPLCFKGAIN
jgi:hypothetical protein